MEVQIEAGWKAALKAEFGQAYFVKIVQKIKQDIADGIIIYPEGRYIFNAFELCPFTETKVVILGQDPYHGPGQAHGLCFSVQDGIKPPPSLVNIYKELQTDTGFQIPNHGNLTKWAKQGVLLLNASLTVQAHKANSHSDIGWTNFTDVVIKTLSDQKKHLVFLLWGAYARKKKALIDREKHLILESAHPSPLSAYNGFFGNRHFSKTNEYMMAQGLGPIDWQL